jgi:hypothetical protein
VIVRALSLMTQPSLCLHRVICDWVEPAASPAMSAMSPKAEVNSEHSRKRHSHCGLMAPRRDSSSQAGASNHANTPRCAVLLLVPALASAFCFSRKLRHAGCPSSCRGRGSTRRHGLGAFDLIQVAHDHGGDQGETNGDGGGQPVTAMVEPVAI